MDNTGSSEPEIAKRIGIVRESFASLSRNIWSTSIHLDMKVHLHKDQPTSPAVWLQNIGPDNNNGKEAGCLSPMVSEKDTQNNTHITYN